MRRDREVNGYRYQFTVTPALPPWAGIRQVEIQAADQSEADAKIGANTQAWLESWATHEGTSYEWAYVRGDHVVKSGIAHPKTD